MKQIFFAIGALAALVTAQVGKQTEDDEQSFKDGLASRTSADAPTIDEWVNTVDTLIEAVVAEVPDSDKKTEGLALLATAKQAILDGEHGKFADLFVQAIKIFSEIKALAKK